MTTSGHFRVRRWAVLIGRQKALSCPPVGSFSCPPTADHELIQIPAEFIDGQTVLDIASEYWDESELPPDRHRFADTVRHWLKLTELTSVDLATLLRDNAAATPQHMDRASAILGILLQHGGFERLTAADTLLTVTPEMEDFYPKARDVPASKRVDLGRQAPT